MVDYNNENAQIAEVKENLSSYITKVQEGKIITILKGKKHVPVAQIVPYVKQKKRRIQWGALKTEKPIDLSNFEFTDEELDELFPEDKFLERD